MNRVSRPTARNLTVKTDVTFCARNAATASHFPARCRGHVETCPHCGNYLDVPDDDGGFCCLPSPRSPRPSQLWRLRHGRKAWIRFTNIDTAFDRSSCGPVARLCSRHVQRDCRRDRLASGTLSYTFRVPYGILDRHVAAGGHAGVGHHGIVRGSMATVWNCTAPVDCRCSRGLRDLVHRYRGAPVCHVAAAATNVGWLGIRTRHASGKTGRDSRILPARGRP